MSISNFLTASAAATYRFFVLVVVGTGVVFLLDGELLWGSVTVGVGLYLIYRLVAQWHATTTAVVSHDEIH